MGIDTVTGRTAKAMISTSLSSPACDKIELHVIDLTRRHDECKHAWAMVSKAESERLMRLVDPIARRRALVARAALREVLGGYLNLAPAQVVLSYTEFGKPVVRSVPLQFSLSHSCEVAVIAVTTGGTVGIDIEHVVRCDVGRLPMRAMTANEIATWERLPDNARCAGFLRYWTAKEAYVKALGVGLYADMRKIEIGDALTKPFLSGAETSRWAVGHFDPRPGVIGTVVAGNVSAASTLVMRRAAIGAPCSREARTGE
jgi:4'-phosphopantetheinyl transferase